MLMIKDKDPLLMIKDKAEWGDHAGTSTGTEQKRKNRKRKRTFLQEAKKHAKRSNRFGNGSELSRDQYEYFVNVLSVWNKGFVIDEERAIFVNNVLQQTENEEVNYSRNQIGSRVIDTFMPVANNEILTRYYSAFDNDLRPILSDRFATHVIRVLLKIAVHKQYEPEVDDEFKETSKKFALKISKFLLNNLEDYVWDTYANHIIRDVLHTFSGVFDYSGQTQKLYTNIPVEDVLPEFYAVVIDFASRLTKWPQLHELPYNCVTSGLMSTLISSLAVIKPRVIKNMMKYLIENSFLGDEYVKKLQGREYVGGENLVPQVFTSECAVPVLETALANVKPKIYTLLLEKLFVGHLGKIVTEKYGNFAVQRLIEFCTDKSEFESIFEELNPEIKPILESNKGGVLACLVQACKRLGTRQAHFLQALMSALNCSEPSENQLKIVPCLLKLTPYTPNTNETIQVTLHGSVLVQHLLEFNKPIQIVNSLLAMEPEQLKVVFSDPKGCHILDSYMKSQYVGERSREKMIYKLKGVYQDLAPTKYGSRSFDAVWGATTLKHKTMIMEELSKLEGKLSTNCGRIIANKINLDLFKRNREQWKCSLDRAETTKGLFSDIIATVSDKKPKLEK